MSVLRFVRCLPGCFKNGLYCLTIPKTAHRTNLSSFSRLGLSTNKASGGRPKYDVVQPIGDDYELKGRLFELEPVKRSEERKIGDQLCTSLTADEESEIVADNPNLSYILKQVLLEIERIEHQRKPLKIPKRMTIDDWRRLLSLTDYRSRLTFLHSVVYGAPSLQQIIELDEVYCKSLDFNEEKIKDIVGDNEIAERNIKQFLYFHEIMRQDGEMVPYAINRKDWIEISRLKTQSKRKKQMEYLKGLEIKFLHRKLKSVDRRNFSKEEKERIKKSSGKEGHILYGLGENTMFMRIEDSQLEKHDNWRTVREFNTWGIPLIIDLSFHNKYKITKIGHSSLIRELLFALSLNRRSPIPFQLHLTGVNDVIKADLKKNHVHEDHPCLNITSQSNLDIFPSEKLVYLSPDSRNDLTSFNPEDIYVIGGIVDNAGNRSPLTISEAKKCKIRHARFPMTRVMGMHCDLNIDTCVAIMNDVKIYNDWFYALRWIPPRYLKNRIMPRETAKPAHQLIYRAHSCLYPNTSKGEDHIARNTNLNAAQYRHYYGKLLQCKSREEMMDILEQLRI